MKPMMIFFEGVDRCGKTTLMKKFNKITKFKYLTIDRGPLSYYVYSQVFQRERSLTYPELYSILARSVIVYVECDIYALENRILRSGHRAIDIEKHTKTFEESLWAMKRHGIRVIKIVSNEDTDPDDNALTLKIDLEVEEVS